MDSVTTRPSELSHALIVTAGALTCAIPLQYVAETMRPLPIEPLAQMPGFIRGVALIRGAPVPVIDLGTLLRSEAGGSRCGRFVTVRCAERRAAVGVDTVIGLTLLESQQLAELPPMLRAVGADVIETIGSRDAQLLVVLSATRLVPGEVWPALAARGSR